MSEIYRKRGRVVRWENGVIVRVGESGIAIEEGGVFRCEPDPKESRPREVWAYSPPPFPGDEGWAGSPHHTGVSRIAARIREIVAPHAIERLIVAEGEAEHDCDGRRWSERSERIHLALVHRFRVLVDQASFDLREIEGIARALDRLGEGTEPRRLRLAPNVAAALASQIGTHQRAGGIDGKGFPVVERPGGNWYRPSYRVPPLRMPMHLQLRCESDALRCESDALEEAPRAIALLAPPHGPILSVLLDDGARAWPATIRAGKVRAAGGDLTFYPYGAGSFGAEMML
ncbi:MAG TPA: hypothetical protein VF111_02565 [Thermoanaerobaculia bacterium]